MTKVHTKFAGQDLWRRLSCEQQFVLFSLRISLHVAQLVPLSLFVSVDSARMLTHPDDSSSSALSRLKTFANPISQQVHISMINFTSTVVEDPPVS